MYHLLHILSVNYCIFIVSNVNANFAGNNCKNMLQSRVRDSYLLWVGAGGGGSESNL